MNALTTTTTPAPSGGFALVPRDMREALSLAEMMAKAGFLARELQNPGGALFVIEQSMRWNMSPFAVAMETSFIQGKPMFSGKIVAAAVTSSGAIAGRLRYEYKGAGDDRQIEVSGLIRGEAEPRTVAVRLRDAKTTNKVWITQPDQQLAYHGARVWARRHAPEVMLGVYAPEETDESDAAPREVPNMAEPAPGSMREAAQQMQRPTEPEGMPILDTAGNLRRVSAGKWLAKVGEVTAKLEDAAALREWRAAMGQHIGAVSERDDLMAAEADRMIALRLAELSDGAGDTDTDLGLPE